jgi:hypothetical protein
MRAAQHVVAATAMLAPAAGIGVLGRRMILLGAARPLNGTHIKKILFDFVWVRHGRLR